MNELDDIDPDWEHVPEHVRELDGQVVLVDGEPCFVHVSPGLWGEADRKRRGFYDGEGAGSE